MAIEISGKEFREFFESNLWEEDTWYDDAVIRVNGNIEEDIVAEDIENHDLVIIEGGEIRDHSKYESYTLERFFDVWHSQQTHTTLVIEFPKEREDEIRRALGALGITLVGDET
jgi:hypothetical protein